MTQWGPEEVTLGARPPQSRAVVDVATSLEEKRKLMLKDISSVTNWEV